MAAFAVRIESVPEGSEREPGTLVACFEAREEAEYFTAIARYLRSLQRCGLSVVAFPMLDRPRRMPRAEANDLPPRLDSAARSMDRYSRLKSA